MLREWRTPNFCLLWEEQACLLMLLDYSFLEVSMVGFFYLHIMGLHGKKERKKNEKKEREKKRKKEEKDRKTGEIRDCGGRTKEVCFLLLKK